MNQRKIWFAGLVTATIGVGIGLVLAKIVESPFTSRHYQQLERIYMLICGTGGLLVGTTQKALRQLQEKRDLEEKRQPPSSASKRNNFSGNKKY